MNFVYFVMNVRVGSSDRGKMVISRVFRGLEEGLLAIILCEFDQIKSDGHCDKKLT